MRNVWRTLGLGVLLVGSAAWAFATTLQELQARADVLQSTQASLAARIDACPGGECNDANDIENDFDAAEAERLVLEADRDAFGACPSCAELDAQLSDMATAAAVMRSVIVAWDDQG